MAPLHISPPLLNSANPWCTNLDQLRELYACPYTGAVTTRTSTLAGYPHNDSIHQFTFFNPSTHDSLGFNPPPSTSLSNNTENEKATGSLNTLGYSPFPLAKYLEFIKTISDELPPSNIPVTKPFLVSITGSEEDITACYRQIQALQRQIRIPLAVEVNLSCPNIPGKPPPAYDSAALLSYLSALKREVASSKTAGSQAAAEPIIIPIGIKTPPYTHHDQFVALVTALLRSAREVEPTAAPCPISFITATNTLGSCLVLSPSGANALDSASGEGIGGLAGAPLHPLALGNVRTIAKLLKQHEKELGHIKVIGVGGVQDAQGARRMESAGAYAVGVGTALGRKGVRVFEEIGVGGKVEGMVREFEREWEGAKL